MRKSNHPMQPLLTIKQVAEFQGTSEKTVRRRIADGSLPAIRDGRLIRVHPDDLDNYNRACQI